MKKLLDLLQKIACDDHEMIKSLKELATKHQKYELAAAIRSYEREAFPLQVQKENAKKDKKNEVTKNRIRKLIKAVTVEIYESDDFKNCIIVNTIVHGNVSSIAESMGILEMGKNDLYNEAEKSKKILK